jgi:hypothetical protein
MAVLGRLLISSAERLDLPDVLSIDSYAAGDFKYLLQGLVNNEKPYVLKGFEVIDPASAIGTQTCSIEIADSCVFYPGSAAGPFFYGLPAGNTNAQPLVPELRKNAVNYVYLTFTTTNTSTDSRAFWDPDKNGGVGGEFTQDVNTESVLTCQVNVSTGAFPANTIPIAKITVGAVVITAIQDARDMMFRLGTGGISPNPFASYDWQSLPNSSYQRNEPPTTMVAGGVNPFEGGDKNIESLKDWMDAVMTKLRELGGTIYWYQDASTYSIVSTFTDALTTTYKSKGSWVHSGTTPGLVTWTEDIKIKLTSDPRYYMLRAGNVQMANENVAYLDLVRNQPINSTDAPVAFTNGQAYINTVGGSVGLFANLSQGDWIKQASDPAQYFLQVEAFFDSVNGAGNQTTAALAKSVVLSGAYLGVTTNNNARYDKGVYTAGDVIVSSRNAAAIAAAGGDFSWLILRSDTIESIGNIATTSLTVSVATGSGSQALVTSTTAHGLLDGQRVTIAGTTDYNGTYAVEVASTTTFYITTAVTAAGPETGTANYATVTTVARSTQYGLQLESADHGFATDETIQITGTTNYNGSFQVAVIDSTHFQIPVAGPLATETAGSATLAQVIVRSELGAFSLVQGESGSIGDVLSQNIKLFLGMTSDTQVYPDYAVPSGYNTLAGTENFNSASTDNVTTRLSELTAMMADKAQDKTVKYLATGLTSVTNTTSGSAQQITFAPAGATLTLLLPGSPSNATVTLPSAAPGISLLANQSAYVIIDRNGGTPTPAIQIANTASLAIGENTFVIATRLTGSNVWLWDGSTLASGSTPISPTGSAQDRNLKVIKGGTWSWTLSTNSLTWTSDAYVQMPGVADISNTLSAQTNTALTADDMVLYVEINRSGTTANVLTITAAPIASVPVDANAFIIARRVNNSIILGNDGMLLIDGESKGLHAGLSVQNRALFGTGVTEATSQGNYSTRGGVARTMADTEGSLDALASIDAEFDKYFGQLRMIAKTAGTTTRVRITGSDRVAFTGETLTQSMSSLKVSFTGAEIDFATGSIYGGDATQPLSSDFTTALGVNFTPASVPSGNYFWYAVTANPSGTNSDNTVNVQFNVIGATASGTTPTDAQKPALGGTLKLGFVVVKDNGSGGAGTILPFNSASMPLPAASAQSKITQLGVGSGSGGGSGLQKVRLMNPTSTVLPTGTVTVDGQTVNTGDLVLFTGLASGNNMIYKAVGTGTTITSWQSQYLFNGSASPSEADTVIVQEGTSYADTVGTFTGTAWSFNNKVRYFNATGDYWEVSSMNSAVLANNQVAPADIFAINWLGSENMWMDYSIARGTTKEAGTILITTDGTNVGIANTNVENNGYAGILFEGTISGSTIHIQYTSTNTGSTAQLKWTLKRWADASGGPGGIPSYSGSTSSNITGSGSAQQIAVWNSPTNVTGNSNFTIDTTNGTLNLGSGADVVQHTILTDTALAANQTDALLFTYSTSYTFAVVEYSAVCPTGNYRIGTLLITQDGSANVNVVDTYSEVRSTGLILASPTVTHTISGSNVQIRYSSAAGTVGTFKYAVRRWS